MMMSVLPVVAQQQEACPVIKLETERLPDLNIPRAGHALFYARLAEGRLQGKNVELTVAGGHTNGFVPTSTAEYLKDGKWHTMPMTYAHDFGLSVVLKSGKVLLAGGCEQPTGIGQTYTAELYDPQTHTFRGFGNMHQKRVWASALELDSGQVVIAGNWYQKDGIEIFHEAQSGSGDYKGKSSFSYVKDVTAKRSTPYIFRMADGDALIIGSNDIKGDTIHSTFADRLKGDTLHIPLFQSWQPLKISTHDDAMSFIGDEAEGDYTYLMPVQDSTGQVAIARVSSTDMTLLSTVCPIPMSCQGDSIEYFSNVIVDRQAHRAYLLGISSNYHAVSEKNPFYVLCIDYDQTSANGGAPLTLYYTLPLEVVPSCMPLLTPEGNLLIAGGLAGSSNYTPSNDVWLLRVGGESEMAASGIASWVWILLAIIALAAITLLVLRHRRCDKSLSLKQTGIPISQDSNNDLMARIDELMTQQKLYLNPDLKITDIASMLGQNRTYVSDCINSNKGCTFSQFVNQYRLKHAQQLLRSRSDIKLSEVWMSSGFSTERTFLRAFKQTTGMTPKEFKAKND